MKRTIVFVPLLLLTLFIQAQTFDEWFHQKKTQISYLIEQIAALQVYATYVEKGYLIADEGLKAIGSIKKGDFNLHENYFSSLEKVNPNIKSYWKIADIISLQIKIVEACNHQQKSMNQSKQFTAGEIAYVSKVFRSLLDGCADIIDQLMTLITDGSAQMKDDERIKRIDQLHDNIEDRYEFVQQFGSENTMLAIQRMEEQHEVNTSVGLFGIH